MSDKSMSLRRKAFITAIVDGLPAAAAARKAGYATNSAPQIGHRLINDPHVIAAITAVHKAKNQNLTRLEHAHNVAVATNDASAAVKAIELQAKLTGVLA